MKTVFFGGKIILENEIAENKYLLVEDGIIQGVFDSFPKVFDAEYDLQGKYISSGFVDIHVHGGGGYDFNDADNDAFIGAAGENFIPTNLTIKDLRDCQHYF